MALFRKLTIPYSLESLKAPQVFLRFQKPDGVPYWSNLLPTLEKTALKFLRGSRIGAGLGKKESLNDSDVSVLTPLYLLLIKLFNA